MRENITKEKELLEQLEEAKADAAETDPKKKAKGVRMPGDVEADL